MCAQTLKPELGQAPSDEHFLLEDNKYIADVLADFRERKSRETQSKARRRWPQSLRCHLDLGSRASMQHACCLCLAHAAHARRSPPPQCGVLQGRLRHLARSREQLRMQCVERSGRCVADPDRGGALRRSCSRSGCSGRPTRPSPSRSSSPSRTCRCRPSSLRHSYCSHAFPLSDGHSRCRP